MKGRHPGKHKTRPEAPANHPCSQTNAKFKTTTRAPKDARPKKAGQALKRPPHFRDVVLIFEPVFLRNLLELLAELFVGLDFSFDLFLLF